jgi:hypothetical protein
MIPSGNRDGNFGSSPGQEIKNLILSCVAVFGDIGRVDPRAAGKLESFAHAPVAAGALPHEQISEIDVLGESGDQPRGRGVEIALDSSVAGLVLAHGFGKPGRLLDRS